MKNSSILFLGIFTVLLAACNDKGPTRTPLKSSDKTIAPAVTASALPTPLAALPSQIGREKDHSILSYIEETAAAIKSNLDSLFAHEISIVALHDEGGHSSSAVMKQTRPDKSCGVIGSISNVTEAFNDCAKIANSTWNGPKNAVNGESNWHLIVRNDTGKEVWLDARTGMLWSDLITDQHWCNASGNKENAGGVDCANLSTESSCLGNVHMDSKGNLDDKLVEWRLPTRNDYLQADIDGIRFVLPNMNQSFWTATLHSAERLEAWLYSAETGTLNPAARIDNHSVRCIGRIIK